MNLCAKPGCANAGSTVLAYDYAARTAVLQDPAPGEVSPHLYVLCAPCAGKLRPPRGWELEDRREAPPLFLDRPDPAAPLSVVIDASEEPDIQPENDRRQLFFGYSA